MRTQLRAFCDHFDGVVRPLLTPLRAALAALAASEPEPGVEELHAALAGSLRGLEALADKVAGQQAYVVIFGPLKSGKSTLMNALAAAYVSEVSSLPAYPCLVFVRHGEERRCVATDYAGRTATFDEPAALRERIEHEHLELAERMRAVEDEGDVFDPEEDLPSAIRRIDVSLPAESLRASEAVLVDTPGLYTRMRFGYDRMTRDFRHAAACAIFVVKSDNLFLDHVFAEFDQLLALFSRVFLVVNQDTTKRDVDPTGALVPSAEQRAPELVLQAFERLAMTGSLQQAMQQGRLQLYAVDLMHAASAALGGGGTARELPQSFVRFRDQLAAYLASEDYILAFLGDALRRADRLVRDVEAGTHSAWAARARDAVRALEGEKAAHERALRRLAACLERGWDEVFARFERDLEAEVKRASRDQAARLARFMGATIDTWFLSSHSVHRLLEEEWRPLVQGYADAVERAAARCFEQSCAQDGGGLDVDAEAAAVLRAFDVDPRALREAAATALGPPGDAFAGLAPLDLDRLPVRRGVLDVVSFRSPGSVRTRLLGPLERPDQKISAQAKKARLGEPAKHFMRQSLMQFHKDLAHRTVASAIDRYGARLRQATTERLIAALRAHEPELRTAVGRLDAELARRRAQLAPIDALQRDAEAAAAKLHALARQYAAAAPELRAEAAGGDPVLRPQPRHERVADRGRARRVHGRDTAG